MTKKKINFNTNVGPIDISTIVSHIGATLYKNGKEVHAPKGMNIVDVADLRLASKNTITFIASKSNIDDFKQTNASVCIIEESLVSTIDKDIYLLAVKNPYASYVKVANLFYPDHPKTKTLTDAYYISDTAKIDKSSDIDFGCYIGDNVSIGKNVRIHPNTYIGDNVVIGNNCTIYSNVTITNTIIGHSTIINSGARIGKTGFGYVTENEEHIKIPHLGRVIIGNDVEIGSNTCIDRGTLEDTVIGDMCKLDNLIQIGHNARLGKGCLLVSQVGIAGSSKLGDYVVVGGQAGVAGHLTIGDKTQIAAKSGVTGNTEPKSIVIGFPAQPVKEFWRQVATLKKLITTKGKK
jgi:UDP-3-O-[3-hydroxymyristoyl] glucosamine N-acyltransferase